MVSAEFIDFVDKVLDMRRVQKEFFKTRSYAAMQTSKRLEKDVDERALKIRRQFQEETQEEEQPSLFDGER